MTPKVDAHEQEYCHAEVIILEESRKNGQIYKTGSPL
jgi:hypothetical protein